MTAAFSPTMTAPRSSMRAAGIDPLLGATQVPRMHLASSERRVHPTAQTFRRRRMTVATGILFAVASVFWATTAIASDPAGDSASVPRTVVAQPGDTIWGIARQIAPTGDISELVDALILANGSRIEVGQTIRIP